MDNLANFVEKKIYIWLKRVVVNNGAVAINRFFPLEVNFVLKIMKNIAHVIFIITTLTKKVVGRSVKSA